VPLPETLSRLDTESSAARFTRELSLVLTGVLLLGFGAVGAAASPSRTAVNLASAELPVAVRQPSPVAVRLDPGAAVPTAPQHRAAAPAKAAAVAGPVARPKVKRWLPTGTGMWIHEWNKTESANAAAVVQRAQSAGLSHLFVQTGSSKKGWIGDPVLGSLLPATAESGIKVIAWDFPKLIYPEDDARRLARATWSRPGMPRVAAVAPDIETASEGTHATADSINRYYTTLRKSIPADVSILATVPWPSENRVGRYPYTRTAPFTDAFLPMAYWYNRSPSVVTATSMKVLSQYGKPVFPVGQGYDGRLDAPFLKPDPAPGKSVDAFVQAARAGGAASISLWSWQTTGGQQWGALKRASAKYAPKGELADVVQPLRTKAAKPGWHPGKVPH
jgi:hypothetical protein